MAASAQNKRKRDPNEVPGGRPAPAMNAPANNEFDASYLEPTGDSLNHDDGVMDFTNLDQHSNPDGNVGDSVPEQQQHNSAAQAQRPGPPQQPGNPHNTDAAVAAMAQYHTMTVPQPTEQTFMQSANPDHDKQATGDGIPAGEENRRMPPASFAEFVASGEGESGGEEEGSPGHRDSLSGSRGKPSVGSDEWHRQRRDNHKEVERRRRETINEGISELSRIVPGCEKNKGSILSRTVQFITQLKENESQNIEKWTLEKLLTEQAITELSSSCDKLKAECQSAWAECEAWKKVAQDAGVLELPPGALSAAVASVGPHPSTAEGKPEAAVEAE